MATVERHRSKREVTVFLATTILLTWLLWFPILLMQKQASGMLPFYNLLLRAGSFIPSVSAIVLAYIFGGKAEVHSLIKAIGNTHIKPQWLLFILFVPSGISAVSCLVYVLLGGSLPPPQFPPWFVPLAFAYILIFMGPLGEEAGWRGFALKRILRYLSPLNAAVILGVIWSVWHTPLFFIAGTTQNALMAFGLLPAVLGYFLYTMMISVLVTLVYIMSDGNIFGSILFHTMANLSLGFIPLIFSKSGAAVTILVLSITTVGFTYKYRSSMCSK